MDRDRPHREGAIVLVEREMYHVYDIVSNLEGIVAATGMLEIGIGVESLDVGLSLYRDALGLEILRRGTVDAATAAALWGLGGEAATVTLGRPETPGAPAVRLLECDGPAGRAPRAVRAAGPVGVGYTTDRIGAVFERLAGAGVAFLSAAPVQLTPDPEGPTGPRRLEAFGQAPDGEFAVLIERQNPPGPYGAISERWGTSEPLHTSHVVAGLEAPRSFLERALGHEVIFREDCAQPETDELMDLPPGTRFRFEMLRHPRREAGRIILIEFPDDDVLPSWTVPPARGLHALGYGCADLDAALERATEAGARVLRGPLEVEAPGLRRGRVAAVESPLGVLLELWESGAPPAGEES